MFFVNGSPIHLDPKMHVTRDRHNSNPEQTRGSHQQGQGQGQHQQGRTSSKSPKLSPELSFQNAKTKLKQSTLDLDIPHHHNKQTVPSASNSPLLAPIQMKNSKSQQYYLYNNSNNNKMDPTGDAMSHSKSKSRVTNTHGTTTHTYVSHIVNNKLAVGNVVQHGNGGNGNGNGNGYIAMKNSMSGTGGGRVSNLEIVDYDSEPDNSTEMQSVDDSEQQKKSSKHGKRGHSHHHQAMTPTRAAQIYNTVPTNTNTNVTGGGYESQDSGMFQTGFVTAVAGISGAGQPQQQMVCVVFYTVMKIF